MAFRRGRSRKSKYLTNWPVRLNFVTVPADTPKQTNFTVTVEVLDYSGNRLTTSAGNVSVTLSLEDDSVGGGTLSGTLTVVASSGLATFNNLQMDIATLFSLRCRATGLSDEESSTIEATAANPVDHLTITVQPSSVHAITGVRGIASGAAFTYTVEARDAGGVITTAADGLSCVFAVTPGSAASPPGTAPSLTGTTTVSFANGVATSTDLVIATGMEYPLGIQLRATRGAFTVDCTAFCVYHPLGATAPSLDTDRAYGAWFINTIGPNGLRTCVADGSLVGSFNDPLSATISWSQTVDANEVTMPAWNASCVFDVDAYYEGNAAAVTACNFAGSAIYMVSVCDIVQNGAALPSFIHEIGNVASDGFWFGFALESAAERLAANCNVGGNHTAYYTHGIAEGTPAYLALLGTRNANGTLRAGGNTATGPAWPDQGKPTGMTVNTIACRAAGASNLFLGADGSNPNLFTLDVYSTSKESSATAWKSALGTALGLSL